MARISAHTRLAPETVIARAINFFHEGQWKMNVVEHTPTCVTFESSGHTLEVSACAEKNGALAEFVSQELDIEVNQFLDHLGR